MSILCRYATEFFKKSVNFKVLKNRSDTYDHLKSPSRQGIQLKSIISWWQEAMWGCHLVKGLFAGKCLEKPFDDRNAASLIDTRVPFQDFRVPTVTIQMPTARKLLPVEKHGRTEVKRDWEPAVAIGNPVRLSSIHGAAVRNGRMDLNVMIVCPHKICWSVELVFGFKYDWD